MTRSRRFTLVCRLLAVLFTLVALARVATAAAPLWDPLFSLPPRGCVDCGLRKDPILLLEPEVEWKEAWQTPGTEQRILELVERPSVRRMLFAAEAARAVPFFLMFTALALALRSMASAGFNSRAVRWLRHSALASIVWTLAHPVAQSIRWTAFSPITHGGPVKHMVLDLSHLLWPALLSAAVWVCVWALEEAIALQQDLDEYV